MRSKMFTMLAIVGTAALMASAAAVAALHPVGGGKVIPLCDPLTIENILRAQVDPGHPFAGPGSGGFGE